MTQYFAVATRGLEFVSEREISALADTSDVTTAYRRVSFAYHGIPAPLLALRTVDDVFLSVAAWHNIGRPRSALNALQQLSTQLDLASALETCASVRPLRSLPAFSVTASFVGKRNYSSDEIKAAVAAGIETQYAWRYEPNDALADVNVRLFIEHEIALVGVRLGRTALQERLYKQAHRVGSLKPSLAAALLMLANVHPQDTLVDPCCGVGTIVIEAAMLGAQARGGDHDPEAVAAARQNVRAAGMQVQIEQWDAQQLPLPDSSVSCVVSNLPWGRQIVVDRSLSLFYRRALAEIQRVLLPQGRVVLLTSVPDLIDQANLVHQRQVEISLFGQRPTVCLFAKPR